jgi:hypothetical protein
VISEIQDLLTLEDGRDKFFRKSVISQKSAHLLALLSKILSSSLHRREHAYIAAGS